MGGKGREVSGKAIEETTRAEKQTEITGRKKKKLDEPRFLLLSRNPKVLADLVRKKTHTFTSMR